MKEIWTKPLPPFRIVGPVYWVGSHELASYLITGSAGHVLINSGVEQSAGLIEARIEQLGFSLRDVGIVTATHGHYDHVAGIADLKHRASAKLMVDELDVPLYETGGHADFRFGNLAEAWFPPVTVDDSFGNESIIKLGEVTLRTHRHSGHTKGATSFTMDVIDGGTNYRVGIINLPTINAGVKLTGMPGYPHIAEDYERTFSSLRTLDFDIWLSSHARHFALHNKHSTDAPHDPARFMDRDGFRAALDTLELKYLTQRHQDRSNILPR